MSPVRQVRPYATGDTQSAGHGKSSLPIRHLMFRAFHEKANFVKSFRISCYHSMWSLKSTSLEGRLGGRHLNRTFSPGFHSHSKCTLRSVEVGCCNLARGIPAVGAKARSAVTRT